MSIQSNLIRGMSEKDATEFTCLLKDFLELPNACCKVMIDKLKNGEYETVICFILKRKQLILKRKQLIIKRRRKLI